MKLVIKFLIFQNFLLQAKQTNNKIITQKTWYSIQLQVVGEKN